MGKRHLLAVLPATRYSRQLSEGGVLECLWQQCAQVWLNHVPARPCEVSVPQAVSRLNSDLVIGRLCPVGSLKTPQRKILQPLWIPLPTIDCSHWLLCFPQTLISCPSAIHICGELECCLGCWKAATAPHCKPSLQCEQHVSLKFSSQNTFSSPSTIVVTLSWSYFALLSCNGVPQIWCRAAKGAQQLPSVCWLQFVWWSCLLYVWKDSRIWMLTRAT